MELRTIKDMLVRRLQGGSGGGPGLNLGQILVKQAQRRIRERGKDIGGYAPLWADTAKITIGKGKRRRQVEHYRKGGTPLYDTGELFRGLHSETRLVHDGIKLTLKGSAIAVFQQTGFKTQFPNWIPFTRAAAREGPRKVTGKQRYAPTKRSYPIGKPPSFLAAKGVTVPARPIFAMPESAKKELSRLVARALGAR
jgi:hypothetical protein